MVRVFISVVILLSLFSCNRVNEPFDVSGVIIEGEITSVDQIEAGVSRFKVGVVIHANGGTDFTIGSSVYAGGEMLEKEQVAFILAGQTKGKGFELACENYSPEEVFFPKGDDSLKFELKFEISERDFKLLKQSEDPKLLVRFYNKSGNSKYVESPLKGLTQ